MKIFNFNLFRKKSEKPAGFSDFFLHTRENEKERIFREAAHKANEEQKRVFMKSRLKTKAG